MGEDHGAIHHELHETELLLCNGAGVVAADLGGDQARQLVGQQPFVQPVDLPPSRRRVGQQRQYDIQGIEHDASRPRCAGLRLQRRQHPAEIEIFRLHQVGHRLGVHEEQPFLLPQLPQLPAEAFGIGHNALRGFLESDEDARLRAGLRAVHQVLQCEDGLARAGSAHQQGGAAAGQTTEGDLIQAGDARRGLGRGFRAGRADGSHGRSIRLLAARVCTLRRLLSGSAVRQRTYRAGDSP